MFLEVLPDIGIPIGLPLSSIISEVFMDKLQTEVFQSDKHLLTYIAFWRRYVDDILYVWTGPIDKVNEFLQFINTLGFLAYLVVSTFDKKSLMASWVFSLFYIQFVGEGTL